MKYVISKDRTKIAFDEFGEGPALIIAGGALNSRAFQPKPELVELLEPHYSVYYYDRRGRGDSGDTLPYAVEREVEDLEALIDEAGGSAYLLGHSSGASLALEAAARLGHKVTKLALYEAPYDSREGEESPWSDYFRKLQELVAADQRGEAVELFMKFVGTPDQMVAGMRQSPVWPVFEAVAPTLVYDAKVMGGSRRAVPVETAGRVTAKALVMDGGANLQIMPFMRASAKELAQAIPGAVHRTIAGQGHDVDPKVLAPMLEEFFVGQQAAVNKANS